MKKISYIMLISGLFLLTNCTSNQNVRGALPSSNPNMIAGAGTGAIAGASVGSLMSKTPSIVPHLFGGIMIGAALSSYADTEGLIATLNQEGVTIIRIGDTLDIIIPMDLLFDGDETTINRSAYPILEQTVKLIKQYGKAPMTITAHTDDVGGTLAQLDRSEKQAQSLTTFLWSHGITLQRMEFYGLSNQESVADFDSSTGAAYNRRIQISLWRTDFRAPSLFYIYTANENQDCWKTDNPDTC